MRRTSKWSSECACWPAAGFAGSTLGGPCLWHPADVPGADCVPGGSQPLPPGPLAGAHPPATPGGGLRRCVPKPRLYAWVMPLCCWHQAAVARQQLPAGLLPTAGVACCQQTCHACLTRSTNGLAPFQHKTAHKQASPPGPSPTHGRRPPDGVSTRPLSTLFQPAFSVKHPTNTHHLLAMQASSTTSALR